MSENAISISTLNDFIFGPVSIYFHSLDFETDKMTYQCSDQLYGTTAHECVDAAAYSTDSSVLQGIAVYSDQYDLFGKIDTFHIKSGILRERKKKIKAIYDGYIFQMYAQCTA